MPTKGLQSKGANTEEIKARPADPTHRPLVDLKVSSTRTKPAQGFRLEEKKGRPEEIGQNEKKTTKKPMMCAQSQSLESQHVLRQSPKYARTGTSLSTQKTQPQLPGTSARPPAHRDYGQQKELELVLPESSRLVCRGRSWFQQGSVNTSPYHAPAGRRHRCDVERERSK